jgi:hypothetical protein
MANGLEALARGLRSAGGVVSPAVSDVIAKEDMADRAGQRQVALMKLQQRLQQEALKASPQYQAQVEALENDRSYRKELAALGDSPALGDVAKIATKYGKPELAANLFKAQEDRAARLATSAENLETRRLQLQQNHELALQRITDQQQRTAEVARHNAAMEALTNQQRAIQQQLADAKTAEGGQGKAPTGYRWKEGQPGVLEPIPGGPATVMTPEQAAKTELLANGIKDVQRYKDLVLKDGKIDRQIIIGMSTPGMAGVPGTDSRLAYSYIYNAIEAKLRAESGAAVPDTEVSRMAKRFIPSPLDNDATIKSKVERLEEFLGGSLGRVKGQPNAGVPQPSIDDLIKKYSQ